MVITNRAAQPAERTDTMTKLPRKNQIVTVRTLETDSARSTFFTGLVKTVSKAHEEFSIAINGRDQWFGADEVVS